MILLAANKKRLLAIPNPGNSFICVTDRGSSDRTYVVDASNPGTYITDEIYQNSSEIYSVSTKSINNIYGKVVVVYGSQNEVLYVDKDGSYVKTKTRVKRTTGVSSFVVNSNEEFFVCNWSSRVAYLMLIDGPNGTYDNTSYPAVSDDHHDVVADFDDFDNLIDMSWGDTTALVTTNGGTNWSTGADVNYTSYWHGWYDGLLINHDASLTTFKYNTVAGWSSNTSVSARAYCCGTPPIDKSVLYYTRSATDNVGYKLTSSGDTSFTIDTMGSSVTEKLVFGCKSNANLIGAIGIGDGGSTYFHYSSDMGVNWSESPSMTNFNDILTIAVGITSDGKYIYAINYGNTTSYKTMYIYDINGDSIDTFVCAGAAYSCTSF